jgi:sphingomyelin phosphodiesterase
MLKTLGYYSVELPKYNNLKILTINTQAGNDENWYLLKNPTDPGKMLEWL